MTSLFPLSSADWRLTEDSFRPGLLAHYESIFALANGYMGVRASLETNALLGDPGFYVAGVYDRVHDFAHEIVNLPCWLGLGINVDGFPVDLRKGSMLEYRRTLDMRQGILLTHIVWRDAGMHTTRFELGRLVHQTEKHLAVQWGTLTPLDYSAKIGFTSSIDAWAVKYASPSGDARLQDISPRDLGADGIGLAVSTRSSGIRVALATRISAPGMGDRRARLADDRSTESVSVPLRQGEPLSFEKRMVVFTSRDGGDPEARAHAAIRELAVRPLASVIESHVAAWAAIWKNADIGVEGDDRAQKALRANIFHLASLANPADDKVSLGTKGLHGNGYNGLIFWDTEIYMLPFYTHTHPAAARALLRYRHRFLDDARENARALGRTGAYYPWKSSIIGRERPWPGWQEHVGSDIAYGIDWYVRATGDDELLLGPGAEIVLETARYWQSRVEPHPDKGYVITGLMGPDEIHGGIDNNCHTNQLVKWHLERAVELVGELRAAGRWDALAARLGIADGDVAQWRRIGDHMYMRFNPELNIHEQFDGYLALPERAIDRSLSRMQYTGPVQHSFKPTKVAQQADTVLMYWMFSERFAEDVRRAGYNYYEPRCSHTSSLSRCIFSAVAAQTGMVEEAYRQFLLSAESDVAAGAEMESESGIHAACMGGTWLAAITGFGGAWVRGKTLTFRPHLPPQWKRLTFPFAWRGVTLEVEITPEAIRLRTRGGDTTVFAGGQTRAIGPEWTSWLPRQADSGVIFDLDGVLVDTAEFHYRAWQQIAGRIGVPFDRRRNEALRGVDRMNSLLLLLGKKASQFTAEEKKAFCAEKNAEYVRLIEHVGPKDLLPGARKLLEDLKSAGIPAAVASSSRNARPVLERLDILPLLTAVVDGSEVAAAKPAPDLFLLAAHKLGLASDRCVVVEDAEAGIEAARAGGMRCIGIGSPERVGKADRVAGSVAGISIGWCDGSSFV